jgi:shikimate dehydrogenase
VSRVVTGAAVVAGVVGSPVTHSLSPLIQGAWIEAAGLDAAYVPFAAKAEAFGLFVKSLRGGVIRGLNVTVPFQERALALATRASERATRAGAANLLIFEPAGAVVADNTDGAGMLAALAERAPGFRVSSGPAVILGAGGAAGGAAAALIEAGAPEVRIVNRTHERAEALARALGPVAKAMSLDAAAFDAAMLVINATTLGLGGGAGPAAAFSAAAPGAVALDMVYRPLRTEFLGRAARSGLTTVDGLAMLIGQAAPSFEAFFGAPPPDVDVRALCLAALGETA